MPHLNNSENQLDTPKSAEVTDEEPLSDDSTQPVIEPKRRIGDILDDEEMYIESWIPETENPPTPDTRRWFERSDKFNAGPKDEASPRDDHSVK